MKKKEIPYGKCLQCIHCAKVHWKSYCADGVKGNLDYLIQCEISPRDMVGGAVMNCSDYSKAQGNQLV
jgi:hypothetical protein